MSDTENATRYPLGWSSKDRVLEHHRISYLSIQVTCLSGGERYLEIVQDDAVIFGEKLTLDAANRLAQLLLD